MPRRRAFSLPEALIALSLMALAASAVLLSSFTALDQLTDARDQALAQGLARQYLDEVLAHPWTASAAWQSVRSQWVAETVVHTAARTAFTTLDDYHDYRTSAPIRDFYGHPWGRGDLAGTARHPNFCVDVDYFANWSVHIQVLPVSDSDLTTPLADAATSSVRRIVVTVSKTVNGTEIPLAVVERATAELPL